MYLQGAGIRAIHDGWQYVKNVKQLRGLMEATKCRTVVNVDSTNILFYDEILEEFPDARFIKITRNVKDVKKSLKKSYGKGDYSSILQYAEILEKVEAGITVNYDSWTSGQTLKIHKFIIDGPVEDYTWLIQATNFKVTLTDDKISSDLDLAKRGRLEHIVQKLRG